MIYKDYYLWERGFMEKNYMVCKMSSWCAIEVLKFPGFFFFLSRDYPPFKKVSSLVKLLLRVKSFKTMDAIKLFFFTDNNLPRQLIIVHFTNTIYLFLRFFYWFFTTYISLFDRQLLGSHSSLHKVGDHVKSLQPSKEIWFEKNNHTLPFGNLLKSF